MKKKIVSLILVFSFMLSLVSSFEFTFFVNAEEATTGGTAVLTVDQTWASAGDSVDVKVTITENPDILGATLTLSWDKNLTLTNAVSGDAFGYMDFTMPELIQASGTIFMWDCQRVKNATTGTVLTLTFTVSDNVKNNTVLPINVSCGDYDIFDKNENFVKTDITNGNVRTITYIPGDVNSDKAINVLDVIRLRQYISDGLKTDPDGYNAVVNEEACDVTGDGRINVLDVIRLRQYISDGLKTDPEGYNVALLPAKLPECNHSDLKKTPKKAATCTEDGNIDYWQCQKCGKFFSDAGAKNEILISDAFVEATGHTPAVDAAVAPTYTSSGLTQGSHCKVCGAVIVKQETIDPLTGTECSIKYELFNNDLYLAKVGIENPNPATYVKEEGLKLLDIEAPDGYRFKGWATSNGTAVTEIPADTVWTQTLYAQWEKIEYKVTFDSPDVPVQSTTYTVDTGITLESPSWYGYTFVGWSNNDGFIVSRIKEGTTGNITLHANWTSNRNRATSYDSYGDPIIIEDSKSGQFLFVYDIGKIDNVPLYEIGYIGNYQKLDNTYTYEYTDSITSEQAELIANTVSNATTRSSGWTLSEDWNKIYTSEEEDQNLQTKSEERTDSEGNTIGGRYFISNSSGGSTYVSNESGGSSSSSSKVTTDKSTGINMSYDNSKETYIDGKLSVSNTTEVSAGVSLPIEVVKVSAGVKNTTTVGAEVSAGRKDKTAVHWDGSSSSYVGTVNQNSSSSYFTTVQNNSNTWNTDEGYEKRKEVSTNTEISAAISAQISKKTNYSVSDSLGGQNSKTSSVDEEELKSNEYQSSLIYSSGSSSVNSFTKKYTVDAEGYYRVVMAGTVHVYGVVGYDVATGSYYTYTFNVLDDERHDYLDYSKDNANFNDCENGVVTFEIPYEVNEYIVAVTARTEGIEVDLEGNITGFEPADDFDGTVSIPQYYSVNNGDNTYTAYLTTAFDANVFKGNTNIKTVILPIGITEIPAGAFEGCTNLEAVIAYGITKIGDDAFKGCSSLKSFNIDNIVTSIGKNAFDGCPEISAMAANASIADAVINSGAKKITLDLTELSDSFDDHKVKLYDSTEYFAIYGGGKTFTNLQIESDAGETFISNMTLTGNTDTPLKLGSKNIKLARLTVDNAPGFALISAADNAEIKLHGSISLSSKGENTVISRSTTFAKMDSGVAGNMSTNGKYLVSGSLTNTSMVTAKGGIEYIDSDTFDKLLTSSTVTFNANGGSVSDTLKTVNYGQYYGALPTPVRANYTFIGWYTSSDGGNLITAETLVSSLVNLTLYAHWTPNSFNVYFDANGGTVSVSSKSATFGNSLGALPEPTRDYHNFTGWYDSANNRVYDSTIPSSAADITLYAHWELKPETTDWVKASELPTGAQVTSRKWSYTKTYYTTSGSSSLSGWTYYNVTSAWSDYGSWSAWQDGVVSESDSRQIETQEVVASANYKTVYHYYYYSKAETNGNTSYQPTTTYGTNRYTVSFDSELPTGGTVSGLTKYKWNNHHNSGYYMYVYKDDPYTTQEVVSYNYKTQYRYRDRTLVYTYYYYRTENLETSTYPNTDNMSNIVEWVKYRAK